MPNIPCLHKTSILDNSKKTKFNKSFRFQILRWMSFLMMPLTFRSYIDRPKLSEQKKNTFDYIVPPQTSWVGIKTSV